MKPGIASCAMVTSPSAASTAWTTPPKGELMPPVELGGGGSGNGRGLLVERGGSGRGGGWHRFGAAAATQPTQPEDEAKGDGRDSNL